MKECRRKHYPACPRNIQEFVDRLADPAQARILEYDTGRLTVKMITDADNAQHAIFVDENFVREEMAEVSKLFIDATYQSTPRIAGAYQLLSIMGIKLNHVRKFIHRNL